MAAEKSSEISISQYPNLKIKLFCILCIIMFCLFTLEFKATEYNFKVTTSVWTRTVISVHPYTQSILLMVDKWGPNGN